LQNNPSFLLAPQLVKPLVFYLQITLAGKLGLLSGSASQEGGGII